MQKIVKIVILLLAFSSFGQQKNIEINLIETLKTQAQSFVGRDAFNNIYTISDNEFKKENDLTKMHYRNVALAKIAQVDLQNPLQVVLFYKLMNSVVVLDSQLNETLKVDFSESNPELLPLWVSLSSQNRLWLFDQTTQKLGLYDYQKKIFHPISVIFEKPIRFSQSDYNYFYWADNDNNLFASNIYGKINFLGKLPAFEEMQIISSKQILLKNDEILSLYDLEKETSQILPLTEKSIKSFCYKEQILAIFTDNEIRKYKIILP